MTTKRKLIDRVFWRDVSEEVKSLNPDLWEKLNPIMEELPDPYFFLAKYPYGELVVDKGKFNLPPGQNTNDSNKVLNELSYSPIPLCLVLDKCVEVFVERKVGFTTPMKPAIQNKYEYERSVPIRMINKGELFGVFETLDTLNKVNVGQQPPWSVSSGARTVVILSKLGNEQLIRKISLNLECSIPEKHCQFDWELIRCVNSAPQNSTRRWEVKLLIFPDWMVNDPKFSDRLRSIIGPNGWEQTAVIRDYLIEESSLSEIYLQDGAASTSSNSNELFHYFTLRHLLALSKGDLPALYIAETKENQAGPFTILQEELLKTEKMICFPHVLQPVRLDHPGARGFYSLSFPTLLAPTPNTKPYKSVIKFLNEMARALESLRKIDPGSTKSGLLDKSLFDFDSTEFYSNKLDATYSKKLISTQDINEEEFEISKNFISPQYSTFAEKVGLLDKNFGFFHCAIRIVRK